MKTSYFSITSYMSGKIIDRVESLIYHAIVTPVSLPTFNLDKTITFATHAHPTQIAIYKKRNGEKVLVKSLHYRLKNSFYRQLTNEYLILKHLSQLLNNNPNHVTVPNLYRFINRQSDLILITDYITGKTIEKFSLKSKVNIMTKVLLELKSSSKKKQAQDLSLPRRTQLFVLLAYHVALLRLLFREPKRWAEFMKVTGNFYFWYLFDFFKKRDLIIAHRDLHSGNILYQKGNIYLIDPEVSAFAEEETDIAILAKSYLPEIKEHFYTILDVCLLTNVQKRKFLGLSLFYALQIMSIREKDNLGYKEGNEYLTIYFPMVRTYLFGSTFEYRHQVLQQISVKTMKQLHLLFVRNKR